MVETKFEVEEGKKSINEKKDGGIFVSKRLALLGLFGLCLILTCSILATYFGKPNDCPSKEQGTTTIEALTTTLEPVTQDRIDYRLSGDLYPILYELTIQPYFKTDKMPEFYNAVISIDFRCLRATNKLVMHMRNLVLKNSTLKITSSTDEQFSSKLNFPWTYDPVTDFFTAEFSQQFKVDYSYTFSVEFKGFINNDETGFYRSSYVDSNENKK